VNEGENTQPTCNAAQKVIDGFIPSRPKKKKAIFVDETKEISDPDIGAM